MSLSHPLQFLSQKLLDSIFVKVSAKLGATLLYERFDLIPIIFVALILTWSMLVPRNDTAHVGGSRYHTKWS